MDKVEHTTNFPGDGSKASEDAPRLVLVSGSGPCNSEDPSLTKRRMRGVTLDEVYGGLLPKRTPDPEQCETANRDSQANRMHPRPSDRLRRMPGIDPATLAEMTRRCDQVTLERRELARAGYELPPVRFDDSEGGDGKA